VIAEQCADAANHAGTIGVFEHEHDSVRPRFHRPAVDAHDPRGRTEKGAADRDRFPFAGGGQFEHVGIIARRAQTRFADLQTEAFGKCRGIYFIDVRSTSDLQKTFQD